MHSLTRIETHGISVHNKVVVRGVHQEYANRPICARGLEDCRKKLGNARAAAVDTSDLLKGIPVYMMI
jgi:hypothetical protein